MRRAYRTNIVCVSFQYISSNKITLLRYDLYNNASCLETISRSPLTVCSAVAHKSDEVLLCSEVVNIGMARGKQKVCFEELIEQGDQMKVGKCISMKEFSGTLF